jgi:Domain of unknown function (DUF1707)
MVWSMAEGTVSQATDVELRVADSDRDRVVDELRVHAAEGRLGVDELEERVQLALEARTTGDLAALTRDLPERPARRSPGPRRRDRPEVRTYAAVMALLVAIWALAGAGYFWPVWPAVGWGLFVLTGPKGRGRAAREFRLPACRPSVSSRR